MKFTQVSRSKHIRDHAGAIYMEESGIEVIVGLGNPGLKYSRTRHNIGFMAVDSFAKRLGRPHLRKKTTSFIREDYRCGAGGITIIKPLMYMNLSGQALVKTGLNIGAMPHRMIVLYDDAAIDFGRIRIRKTGSAGGHKGMKNIIDVLQTKDIPRIRLGIGPQPQGMPLEDFVLRSFMPDEKKLLPEFMDSAADALEAVVADGFDVAMGRFNSSTGLLIE